MTQYEISAIIGHWRNGASILEICGATGLMDYQIEKVIKDYEQRGKK